MLDPRDDPKKFDLEQYRGAPLTDIFTIRVSKPMAMAIRTRAMMEKVEPAVLIRRYLAIAAIEEELALHGIKPSDA